ncbi:MAG: glutamate racemase [Burkholderiales bacterium]|jgi:glutamate racemase|nr:glutamate racemase [Burkholderiales bacterium]
MKNFDLSLNNPIGVFDSGMGGLTVMREIMSAMPHENIIYFGDIARLPYGTKSVTTIRKFALQTAKFLINQNVKAIVIACNTISAIAKDEVQEAAGNIPVVDVISAGSRDATSNGYKNVGVIATPATINSKAYPVAINQLNPTIEILSQACALFVPMIEEGFTQHKALELIAHDYLDILKHQNIDALVLGCTHYPLIKDTIAQIMGNSVKIIDPAITACNELNRILTSKNILNPNQEKGNYHYFVTDIPLKFKENGERFLGTKMDKIELVNLDEYLDR